MKKILVLSLIIFVIGIFVMPISLAYAEDDVSIFESTDVLSDLSSAVIDGEKFDKERYRAHSDADVQIITLVEYGYSYRVNDRDNYGLYLYLYNPSQINIVDSRQNKIQMSVEYDTYDYAVDWEKYVIRLCSNTTDRLFYKFKIIDHLSGGQSLCDRVDMNGRRYSISGVELLQTGNQNATEYSIGLDYTYSGYSKGLGQDKDINDLSCVCKDIETVDLTLRHTYYRTNVSSLGAGHYNQINTVYFSVPDRFFQKYGNLQRITAEWYEYLTEKILVTSDSNLYNTLYNYRYNSISYDEDMPSLVINPYNAVGNTYTCNWKYNLPSNYVANDTSDILPYVFFSTPSETNLQGIFDFLYNDVSVGDVTRSQLANYVYNYNDLEGELINCNGRFINRSLFKGAIEPARSALGYGYGHNVKTIDLDDTFDLLSYDSNHSWWQKLWDYGLSAIPLTGGDLINIMPIYEVNAADFLSGNASDNLLINSNDVSTVRTYYATESLKGNHIILFRFANTDYFCDNPILLGENLLFQQPKQDAYVCQQTCFLDFDVISLTFSKDSQMYEIPAVASPIDIFSDLTAPPKTINWLKLIGLILGLIVLLIILIPLLPYIIKGIVWLVTLPFKLLAKLFGRKK